MAPAAPQAAAAAPSSGGVAPPGLPGRLTLIGAGHVFDVQATLRNAIVALQPDVVFVELDRGRLEALLHRARGGRPPEAAGFVHRRLARFQESVASLYGAQVGAEMLGAVQGAQAVGARLELVDDPVQATLARLRREITWRERLRLAGMLAAGALRSLRPRRDARRAVEEELRRYQDDPLGVLEDLEGRLPTVHRILIRERDGAMARRIRQRLAGTRHGVAVVGDGHVNGMAPLLADLDTTVYRLADVRAGRLPRGLLATGTPERIGFTLQARAGA